MRSRRRPRAHSGAASPRARSVTVGDLTFSIVGAETQAQAPATSRTRYVLIHGIGTSHHYFAGLHRELARTADTWSVDLPGFGGTPKPAASPTVHEMAAALGVVLDHWGGPPYVLIGHSMGAQWAVELARVRPDLVAAVVLIGPVVDRAHRSLRAQLLALLIDACKEPPRVNTLAVMAYLRCGPRYFLRQAKQMKRYRTEAAVSDLRVPILVLRGARDPVAGARWARELRDTARAGSLVTVPGRAHAVHATAPRSVARAVRAFARERVTDGTSFGGDGPPLAHA